MGGWKGEKEYEWVGGKRRRRRRTDLDLRGHESVESLGKRAEVLERFGGEETAGVGGKGPSRDDSTRRVGPCMERWVGGWVLRKRRRWFGNG